MDDVQVCECSESKRQVIDLGLTTFVKKCGNCNLYIRSTENYIQQHFRLQKLAEQNERIELLMKGRDGQET